MDGFYIVLGLVMIYAFIHLITIQNKAYKSRTTYEKVITWVGFISAGLVYLSVMFG